MVAAKVVDAICKMVGHHGIIQHLSHIVSIDMVAYYFVLEEVYPSLLLHHAVEAVDDVSILALVELAPSEHVEEPESYCLLPLLLVSVGFRVLIEEPLRPCIDIMRQQMVQPTRLVGLVAIYCR